MDNYLRKSDTIDHPKMAEAGDCLTHHSCQILQRQEKKETVPATHALAVRHKGSAYRARRSSPIRQYLLLSALGRPTSPIGKRASQDAEYSKHHSHNSKSLAAWRFNRSTGFPQICQTSSLSYSLRLSLRNAVNVTIRPPVPFPIVANAVGN